MTGHLCFGGHDFEVAGEAALFWPARKALLVADLHLEKASSYAIRGQFLPPYDSRATLEELAGLARKYAVEAIFCLGDNFHDDGGEARLEDEAARLLRQLTVTYDWRWIVGNHDPGIAANWGGAVHEELNIEGIILLHEAEPQDRRPEMSGHFHPKFRQEIRGRLVSRRCFVRSASKLILPAFGALTGGLEADDSVISEACGGYATQALVPATGRVLCFPLSASRARAE
ncbi:ligase-associated DNA damage response endonuclease PdeM [uncultured Sphingorhabdus sp.]|uniref:ligase-associated DNA damage response endonuclease PdeM n=1 Tax=uncultured Sphingorhabdus sp. TaxID=1686106 RepID=UPI00261A26DD|nr:ligase-associated DNA damage response endonuclease PdeM [uncultured Sphingorhabdus sp.]HMS22016.1 ligase-associated DNA damage response endonuclease PdeM [Sphingorhabdus sp.]